MKLRACMEAMLRSAGFAIPDHPEDEVFVCRPAESSSSAPQDTEQVAWSKR
jgi:tRNA (mo5U34)-methyltransferase